MSFRAETHVPQRRRPVLDLPPFPQLEWDDYFWTGQTILNSWRGFQSRLGPYGAESSNEQSDGGVRLEVASPDEDHQGPPTSEEVRAYEFLLNHEETVRDAVLDAIFEAYPGMRDSYGYDEEEAEELMPAIQQAGELRNLIGLSTVHILCVAKDGVAYVGSNSVARGMKSTASAS